jgi:hypothetical protein
MVNDIMANVLMANVLMANVLMANVLMANVLMANVLMANIFMDIALQLLFYVLTIINAHVGRQILDQSGFLISYFSRKV